MRLDKNLLKNKLNSFMQNNQFSHQELLELAEIIANDPIFKDVNGRVRITDIAFGTPEVARNFPLNRKLPILRYDDEHDEAAFDNLKILQNYGVLPDGRSAVLAYIYAFKELASEQTKEELRRLNLFQS